MAEPREILRGHRESTVSRAYPTVQNMALVWWGIDGDFVAVSEAGMDETEPVTYRRSYGRDRERPQLGWDSWVKCVPFRDRSADQSDGRNILRRTRSKRLTGHPHRWRQTTARTTCNNKSSYGVESRLISDCGSLLFDETGPNLAGTVLYKEHVFDLLSPSFSTT